MSVVLPSRCGIYCGACYVYSPERDGGDFLKQIDKWQKVGPEQVKCNGCFAADEEKWPNCRECSPWECLEEKGLSYCYQCEEFWENSCKEYSHLEEFCSKRGENIRQNMLKMKKDTSKWLEEQDKKWRCRNCGEPYSWYEENCHHCKASLDRKDLLL
jgi:hypothetical protein